MLSAEQLHLTIRYLGLPVVNVVMTDNGSVISVQAKATKIASIAAKMDNSYISEYKDNYLPISYKKVIDQKDYEENRVTEYDRDILTAKRSSYLDFAEDRNYAIKSESRDFFSSLYYLRTICDQPFGELWLDANSLIWKATYRMIDREILKTEFGKIEAFKVELTFQQISQAKKENTDMLTNNLVNEERSLIFWFSNDERRLPLKAKFMMKPFAVTWKLETYHR